MCDTKAQTAPGAVSLEQKAEVLWVVIKSGKTVN